MKDGKKYSLKAIFGLSVLYYFAIVLISFGTVLLEHVKTKTVDTEITWIFILPWSSHVVEVNPVFFISGIAIDIAACLLLWKWHSFVLSKNAEDYTKGWRTGYTILLIISVILCLLAESAAYFVQLFDSRVKNGTVLGLISFFTVPIIMAALVVRRNRMIKNRSLH
ncbi:MAG: hypothetical protein K6F53_06805 [Lachnospiraceae bacterium]|nr:hypothetical protein [Lachnospiraceae bacterium]